MTVYIHVFTNITCGGECTMKRYWVTQLCSNVLRTITIKLSVLKTNSTVCTLLMVLTVKSTDLSLSIEADMTF